VRSGKGVVYLVSLIQSAAKNDMVSFRRSVESLIAEERAKKHNVLADRLTSAITFKKWKCEGKYNSYK